MKTLTDVGSQGISALVLDAVVPLVERVVEGVFVLILDIALEILHGRKRSLDFVDNNSIAQWCSFPSRDRQPPQRLVLAEDHFPVVFLAHVVGDAALSTLLIKVFDGGLVRVPC